MSNPSCPLCLQRTPDDLDAEVVAQLLELLYAIADHFQQRHHHQLLRYHAELRDPPQVCAVAHHRRLADDEPRSFSHSFTHFVGRLYPGFFNFLANDLF